jgi:hypothetical protein
MSQYQTVDVGAREIRIERPRENGVRLNDLTVNAWKDYEKIFFRFVFIYFFIQAVPLDWKYFRDLLALDWTPLTSVDFFYLGRYAPRFISDVPVFGDWLVVGVLAAVGSVIWSVFDKSKREYNDLYYVLRVIVRYRLALALLAYGFVKFYPILAPEPSISDLNTNYGDLTAWKIFSLSLGIVPGYESFLGLVEIAAALLLLNRKTASIGAFVALPFLGNVFISNLAYEGQEYVYSLLLITFGLLLFYFDFFRIARLTSFEKTTPPNKYKLSFGEPWKKYGRLAGKSLFILLFVVVLGITARYDYKHSSFVYPSTPGLAGTEGLYNVEEFRVNQKSIPPSVTDQVRWKDVVFEKWNTLSVRLNNKQTVRRAGTTELFTDDSQKNYEFTETSGRVFYSYTADTVAHVINVADHSSASTAFNYSRPDENTILLSGTTSDGQPLEILLRKIDKKYLLKEAAKGGRRRGLKL